MRISSILATLALLLLTATFTFPIVAFHGTLNTIDELKKLNSDEKVYIDKRAEITPLVEKMWNFYNEGRYKSTFTEKYAHNDLDKMIESEGEIGAASLPIWSVSLEAPNYPKRSFPDGIPVYFHFDGYSGEVHEMDIINHYVGMHSMWEGGQIEREAGPYLLLFLTIGIILFIFYRSKIWTLVMLVTALLPVFFVGLFVYWLRWFGTDLNEMAAFKLKSFMPTAFGEGKVAQFTSFSYPDIGFYALLVISLFSLIAIYFRGRERRAGFN